MGRTWTHDGVSDGCSTASRPRPDDGRRSFIRVRPKRPFRRFSPYVCLPRLNPSRPTQRSMPSSSPRTGMTGSNSIPAGACGSWASPSIASVPATSTTISGTPPSIRKSEQAAAIPPARINLNSGILNPELLSPELGPKVATLWGKCGLQDRMDAVIAHEHLKKGGLSMATATDGLQNALHITARVQSGNKIEITAPGLQEGQDVDVYLVPRPSETPSRRSVLEFLDSLPSGPRSAPTWDEVERRFQEERDAWDR